MLIKYYYYIILSTEGASLPVTCNPSSSQSQRPKPAGSAKKPLPKVMNARHLSGGIRTKDTIEDQQAKQGTVVPVPPKGSKCRMLVHVYHLCKSSYFNRLVDLWNNLPLQLTLDLLPTRLYSSVGKAYHTGRYIAEVTSLNPVEASESFLGFLCHCLSCF